MREAAATKQSRGARPIRAVVFVAIAVAAGCASPPPQKPTYSERIILLPSRDGKPSALIVKRASGEQQLTAPFEGVESTGGEEKRFSASAAEVQQRYGETLAVQPARPLTFMLFFNLGTTDLTPQSRTLVQDVQRKITSFPAPQVTVVGHADAVGTVESNDALSLKRATAVRDYLIEIGVPREAIDVVGRGSRELLVPTKPGVAEERNRRVEVRLR